MNVEAERLKILRQWAEKADGNLLAAEHVLTLGDRTAHIVLFHAQQCIEKYLKALLVWRHIDFPKTHDLAELLDLLPQADRPELPAALRDSLTHHAAAGRYPSAVEIREPEGAEAIAAAKAIRDAVRKRLPPEALSEARNP